MNWLPLEGIRIADFTWIGAGSFTTKLFADFGADVIKVESGERLDALRTSPPFRDGVAGVNRSGYFADRNTSKRSITLNLKTEKGRALARQLVGVSDVVANNFSPGTMDKFGLGYEDVRQIRPEAIYLAMSMQGASGPDSKYLGFGLTIGALTGLQFLSGLRDKEPAGTGTNYPDHVPNPCHAAFAVLAALRYRAKTGQGQFIDLAQTEPMISLLGPAILQFTANGMVTERSGNERLPMVPHGVYPCAGDDQWIAIAAWTDEAWKTLAQTLGKSEWLQADVATIELRIAQREMIDKNLAIETRRWSAEELMSTLQARGIAAGVVRSARDVVVDDAQLRYRDHWAYLEHPEMGRCLYNRPPFRMSDVEQVPRGPAPLLGQHTNDVCRHVLKLSETDIAALRSEGVLT
jgi:benzylsuccinate CoA-transferase BbsF subunit